MEKINDELKLNNFIFKKKFGQNFITDSNLLKAIVKDANITKDDDVLEIGVGASTLTKEILLSCNKLVGYEIDETLKSIIANNLCEFDNYEIIFKDFMKEDESVLKNKFENGFKVVANLPYYITTPIIFKILDGDLNVKSLTIMVQKEVAERICSKAGSKDYGILSVMVQSVSNVSIKRIVNRNMFKPVPDVDSAICHIEIDRNKFNIKNYKLFSQLVKVAFGKRRKIFISNLKNDLGLKGEILENIFTKLNFDLKLRGEVLSVEDFVNLSNELVDYKGL